jgi:hypothetical protein
MEAPDFFAPEPAGPPTLLYDRSGLFGTGYGAHPAPAERDRAFRGSASAPAPPTAWRLRPPPIPCADQA